MATKDFYGMSEKQRNLIQRLFFERNKTYHRLADEAGIGSRPDKFEDLDYFSAQKIIDYHLGND